MDRFNQLKSLVDSFEKDFEKFYDKENKAAGVRVPGALSQTSSERNVHLLNEGVSNHMDPVAHARLI